MITTDNYNLEVMRGKRFENNNHQLNFARSNGRLHIMSMSATCRSHPIDISLSPGREVYKHSEVVMLCALHEAHT